MDIAWTSSLDVMQRHLEHKGNLSKTSSPNDGPRQQTIIACVSSSKYLANSEIITRYHLEWVTGNCLCSPDLNAVAPAQGMNLRKVSLNQHVTACGYLSLPLLWLKRLKLMCVLSSLFSPKSWDQGMCKSTRHNQIRRRPRETWWNL